jgi:hypothetical protein
MILLVKVIITCTIIFGIACISTIHAGSSVALAWDPDTNAAGYYLYYGTASRSYAQRIAVGNATTATVPNLSAGQTYFFAVTAYNTTGESTPSNEVTYTTPFSSTANAPPIPFVLNGVADSAGYLQNSTGMTIYAAVRGTKLYVATWSPGGNGGPNDHFIFVSDQLLSSATTPAPWAKAGKIAVPANKPYLAGESMNSYVNWFNAPADSQSAKAPTNSGVMEGVLDLVEAFGLMPQKFYIAAAAYQTFDGGALDSQGPPGNGDKNLDPGEFMTLWTPAITDQFANGIYDWLNPNVALHPQITRNITTGVVSITWPSVPGKSYKVEVTDLLIGKRQILQSQMTAGPGVLQLSTSYLPTNLDTRFYHVDCLNP